MHPRRFATCPAAIGCLLLLSAATLATAAGGDAPAKAGAGELTTLVARIDADDFVVRRAALQRLEVLLDRINDRPELAAELRRLWTSPELSTEARAALAPLEKQLAQAQPSGRLTGESLAREIAALDASDYDRREAAQARLEPLTRQMPQAFELGEALKRALTAEGLSRGARREMHTLWKAARGTWLAADELSAPPKITERDIERWIDELIAGTTSRYPEARIAAENAERELLDALAHDASLDITKPALELRLIGKPLSRSHERLTAIYDWTRPAMVAECWEAGHHTAIQHLLIGIPSHPAGAPRASHFDRCDDRSAHCVTGNSLSPGDWPVGVFFPHPLQLESEFQLVNLPTPRRRMAYQYLVDRDETLRLRLASENTLSALLKAGATLDERQIVMLRHLDAGAVSRFAARYLTDVDDLPLDDKVGCVSRHGLVCAVLIERGTHEAIAGLTRAWDKHRIIAPTPDAPYQIPWIAALVIANRDPWPGIDAWLESLLPRALPLAIGNVCPADLGATAAAILLERHGMPLGPFGLEAVPDTTLGDFNCPAFRYRSPEDRERVIAWWSGQKAQLARRLSQAK